MKLRFICACCIAACIPFGSANAQDSVYFDIQTNTGKDTFYVGEQSALIFNFDPRSQVVPGLCIPLEFVSSSDDVLGPAMFADIVFTPEAIEIYELSHLANVAFWDGTGTDSLLLSLIDGGGDFWPDSAEVCRFNFVPQATGSFHMDSIVIPPANHWEAIWEDASSLPFEIRNYGHEYAVVFLNGDVNADGRVTASDILYLVGYCFKGGPPPVVCTGIGDVNCSGAVTTSDVLGLVNYIFKGDTAPCDIETLIPDTWSCP